MVELGACVRANDLATACIALEEQDVKRVGFRQELLLRDLLLLPENVGLRR